jgi:tetratricopeptide (TPR) repeat protein
MNSIRNFCLIIVAAFVLALCLSPPMRAQSSKAVELNQRVIELYRAGKYAEAIPLAQQLLAIREKTLGPNHPDVASALNNLAALYEEQSLYEKAEPLYKQALVIREKTLRPDDPDVAHSLNTLADLYNEQGRYAEASPLYKRVLAIAEKKFSPDGPEVASALTNLALLYQNQGQYPEAVPLFERVLAITEKALGFDHPDVAVVLTRLANLYAAEDHYNEAEPLLKRSLAIREKTKGPDHPGVANALNDLALLYYKQGRFDEAEALYKRELAIEEKLLGPDDPDVAAVLQKLAKLYRTQGRYDDAEPLYKRVLTINEKGLGPDDPDVAGALNNLAALYHDQERYAEAEPLLKRALAIQERMLAPDDPNVATALNTLALVYSNDLHYDEAEKLYLRALAIWEKTLGPNRPDIAVLLNNLALLYINQGRYSEAEPLLKRALMIGGPSVADALNNLAYLYSKQARYADALPLVRRVISNKSAATWATLPVLFGAQSAKLVSPDEAIETSLYVAQQALQTSAGQALNSLAVRFAAGNGRLAQLVRRDQDLAGEAAALDKAVIVAVSEEPSGRDAAAEQRVKEHIAAVAKERNDLQAIFRQEFPDYAALSNPEPLTVSSIQGLLDKDEGLVIVELGDNKSYVWAVTRSTTDWRELPVTTADVAKMVSALRAQLNFNNIRPFDPQPSFVLYQKIMAPVANMLADKARLSFVLSGALTSLPPQLLVTRDPAGKALKDVSWLIRTHAVTVLPSVESLKVLRGKSAMVDAAKPLIGFADPILNADAQGLAQNGRLAADVAAARGIRGMVADIAELRLPPLPETAGELREVAASVHADPADIILGADATVSRVEQEKLDQFRIVYFATHGLVAGDVAQFAQLNAEPALVLSLPDHPSEADNGLLTASKVAQLKLNADWVVLSACNTAAAQKPGAEALSGLARAFFYAGARSLVVSNWEVDSKSAVVLMVGTFGTLATDPRLSHAQALQKSMLAMIDDATHPERADPKYWAPFIVVGEPPKLPN